MLDVARVPGDVTRVLGRDSPRYAAGGRAMGFVHTHLGAWRYEEHGRARHLGAPALVLLHGLMLDRRMWSAQVGVLATLGRVLVFDGPGHGVSDEPPPFTLEEQAEALEEALEAAGVGRAVVVGHSWGGMVGLCLAARFPRRVAGLVVIGGSAEPEAWPRWLKYRLFVAWVRHFGAPWSLVRLLLAGIVYGARARRERPELVRELWRTLNAHPRRGLARAALAVIERGHLAARLARVSAPTLVMCGHRDGTMPLRSSEGVARRIPGARLVVLPGGHTPPVEQPAEFNAALLPFLRQRLAPAVRARVSSGQLGSRPASPRL